MNDIQILIDELVKFRDARHWEQFHNTKDLALAISIEAAELNELFLWKTNEESELIDRNKIKEELADVIISESVLLFKQFIYI
jgi:NTP pyrophosphatase (non-canonical NTP hydrolase)